MGRLGLARKQGRRDEDRKYGERVKKGKERGKSGRGMEEEVDSKGGGRKGWGVKKSEDRRGNRETGMKKRKLYEERE